jgi:hypothetical protein
MIKCCRLVCFDLCEHQRFSELRIHLSSVDGDCECSSFEFYSAIASWQLVGALETSLEHLDEALKRSKSDMCSDCRQRDCENEYLYTRLLRLNALAREEVAWETLKNWTVSDASTQYRIGLGLLAALTSYLVEPAKTRSIVSEISQWPAICRESTSDCFKAIWVYLDLIASSLADLSDERLLQCGTATDDDDGDSSSRMFVFGDSHTVSQMWRRVTYGNRTHTLEPLLCRSLEAWHLVRVVCCVPSHSILCTRTS